MADLSFGTQQYLTCVQRGCDLSGDRGGAQGTVELRQCRAVHAGDVPEVGHPGTNQHILQI